MGNASSISNPTISTEHMPGLNANMLVHMITDATRHDTLAQNMHVGIPKTEVLTCQTSVQRLVSLLNDEDSHSEYLAVRDLLKKVNGTLDDISKNNDYKLVFKKDQTSYLGTEMKKLLIGLNQVLINLYNLLKNYIDEFMKTGNNATTGITHLNVELYLLLKEECNIILNHEWDQWKLFRKFVQECQKHAKKMNEENPDDEVMDPLKFIATSDANFFDVASFFEKDNSAKKFWQHYFDLKTFVVKKDEFCKNLQTWLIKNYQNIQKRRSSYSSSNIQSLTDEEVKNIVWLPEFEILLDPTCDGYISVSDFRSFLGWFGPLDDVTKNTTELITAPWFWGSLSSLDAQKLLDKEETGTFLVRFDESRPGHFCITCVEEQTESGFDGNGGGQMTYLGEEEVQQAIHFKVKKENNKIFLLSGSDKDKQHIKIETLLKQYELTFKYPFGDEKIKYRDITDFRIRDEEEEEESMGFYGFLRDTSYKGGLNRPLVLADLNFALFRSRIPDIPFVPRDESKRKKRMEKKNKDNANKRRIVARKSNSEATEKANKQPVDGIASEEIVLDNNNANGNTIIVNNNNGINSPSNDAPHDEKERLLT